MGEGTQALIQHYAEVSRRLREPPPRPMPSPPIVPESRSALVIPIMQAACPCCGYDGTQTDRPPPTMRMIVAMVAAREGPTPLQIVGSRRIAAFIRARFMVCHLAIRFTGLSYSQIGRHLGGRDHSTVMHAMQKIASLRQTDRALDIRLNEYEAWLGGRS